MGGENQYPRVRRPILLCLLAGVFVFALSERDVAAQTCTPYWSCTVWSACSNDAQTRSCTDVNSCGSVRRPAETQVCPTGPEIIPDIAPTGGDLSGTAPATGNPTTAACTPYWSCAAWSACSNGYQTRSCTDANNCGTFTGIPLQSATCEASTTACTPVWDCAAWSACVNNTQTRGCSDVRSCGVNTGKPLEQQSCTLPVPVCVASWSCTAWSSCIADSQNRSCTDANGCGTTAGKPVELQNCTVAAPAPSAAPPAACTSNWSCTAWSACSNGSQTRTCTDTAACGTTAGKPATLQDCTEPSGGGSSGAAVDRIPPATPAGLTATPVAPTQVDLAWSPATDNVAVVGYQVYQNGVRVATPAVAAYADTAVTVVTWYAYAVAAIDAAGNVSPLSAAVNVLTPPPSDGSPPTIFAITAAALTQNSAYISWQTSEPAVSSAEYGFTTSYGLQSPWSAAFGTAHAAGISGLAPGNTYHYRVVVRDSSGNLARSQDFSFRTAATARADLAPPPPVADLAIEDVQQTSLVLRWTAPEDVSGVRSFDIRYAAAPLTVQNFSAAARVQTTAVPATLGARQSQYISIGLTPGATYYFALMATDGAGNVSPLSNVPAATMQSAPATVSVIPSVQPGTLSVPIRAADGSITSYTVYQLDDAVAPAAPRQVVAQGTDAQVTLRWVNPTDPDFVRVQVQRSIVAARAAAAGLIIYEGRDETFTDVTPVNGVTYTYAVTAYDRSGNFTPPVYLYVGPRSGVTQADAPVVTGAAAGGKRLAWLVMGKQRRQLFVVYANGQRRLIGSLALAEQLGVLAGLATVVDERVLEAYPLGPPLTAADTDLGEVLDSDGDALADAFEGRLGTDPAHPDTDRDGASDGQEWRAGTDPQYPAPAGRPSGALLKTVAGRFIVGVGAPQPLYYVPPAPASRFPLPDEFSMWQLARRAGRRVPHRVIEQLPRSDGTSGAGLLAARLEGWIVVDVYDGRLWYIHGGRRWAFTPGRWPEPLRPLAVTVPLNDLVQIPYRGLAPAP